MLARFISPISVATLRRQRRDRTAFGPSRSQTNPLQETRHGRPASIPGTTPFDGEQARKGYALNKMCYSFNDAANREAFVRDEDAYCASTA